MGIIPFELGNEHSSELAELAGNSAPKDKTLFGMNGAAKRILDIAAVLPAILFFLPALITAAIAVKLCDRGPVLYRQERIGRNGKRFSMLKFRTLKTNSDEVLKALLESCSESAAQWNEYQKLPKDPRITRVGRFLRRTSIDELPQLFNILRGDMSVVGQRPILASQIDQYGIHIAGYYRARPGLTGLWQVRGRNGTTFARRAELGSEYMANWSLWGDIKLIFATVPAVLASRGAY